MVLTRGELDYLGLEITGATESCARQYDSYRGEGMTRRDFAYYVGGLAMGLFLHYQRCCLNNLGDLSEEDTIYLHKMIFDTIDAMKERLYQSV